MLARTVPVSMQPKVYMAGARATASLVNSWVARVAPRPAFCMPISNVNARRIGSGSRSKTPLK